MANRPIDINTCARRTGLSAADVGQCAGTGIISSFRVFSAILAGFGRLAGQVHSASFIGHPEIGGRHYTAVPQMSASPKFLAVCLNPTLQKTLVFSSVRSGDVNRCLKSRLDASGKGVNVTRVLVQLGESCTHLTHAGGQFRRIFINLAQQSGVALQAIDSKSDIRFCTTMIELESDTTTELVETSERVSESTEARVRRAYTSLIKLHEFVVISGTKAAGYSEHIIPDMVMTARNQGCRVILDVQGTDLVKSLEFKPEIIKPNFSEFAATFEHDLIDSKPSDPVAVERIEARMRQVSWPEKDRYAMLSMKGTAAGCSMPNNWHPGTSVNLAYQHPSVIEYLRANHDGNKSSGRGHNCPSPSMVTTVASATKIGFSPPRRYTSCLKETRYSDPRSARDLTSSSSWRRAG